MEWTPYCWTCKTWAHCSCLTSVMFFGISPDNINWSLFDDLCVLVTFMAYNENIFMLFPWKSWMKSWLLNMWFLCKIVKLEFVLLGYSDFEILAFPCNQFLRQEPGSSEEAKEFACTRYKAEYPIFQKVFSSSSSSFIYGNFEHQMAIHLKIK